MNRKMKLRLVFLIATISVILATNLNAQNNKALLIEKSLLRSQGGDILVAAHRGDWRNAPENSLQAIKNAIDMGVDIVEIDIGKTKDNKLILMHDVTLDRTTNGKGKVSDWTLDSLKTLYLRDGLGSITHYRIPTLEEALEVAKDKVMLNLDKCYPYIKEAYPILVKTGTVNQVIIKGPLPVERVKKDFGALLSKVHFMPVIYLDYIKDAEKWIQDYQKNSSPVAFELVFGKDTSVVLKELSQIKRKGSRIWINSLWAGQNAGHYDDMAVTDPDACWGWLIRHGANILQTDRPTLMLKYLRSNGVHK